MVGHYVISAAKYDVAFSGIVAAAIVGMSGARGDFAIAGLLEYFVFWLSVLLPTVGYLFSIYAYRVFRNHEYYLYYNIGLSKAGLRLVSFLPREKTPEYVVMRMLNGEAERAEILEDEAISVIRRTKNAKLSGGERRYLEARLVLSLGRRLTILDEPFSELDPIREARLGEIIRSRKSGSVLMSDHRSGPVMALCPICYLLRDGRLLKIDGEAELRAHGYLVRTPST
jgi:ABC-type multidrug transport system ATPase subunit